MYLCRYTERIFSIWEFLLRNCVLFTVNHNYETFVKFFSLPTGNLMFPIVGSLQNKKHFHIITAISCPNPSVCCALQAAAGVGDAGGGQ